jgi:hypothetical protein
MPLTFVHLSDIHFQRKSGDEYKVDDDLRNELIRDLIRMDKKIKPINGILITGDIAFYGKEEEYSKAEMWLKEFCQKINCNENNIWMVPGNHDIDRVVVQNNPDLQKIHSHLRLKAHNNSEKELCAILEDKKNIDIIFTPMHNYCLTAEKYGCGISPKKPYWEKDFELDNNLKLRLRGLTSTIISDNYDDCGQNKLILGEVQVMMGQEDNVVYMILCHHPPDWLMDKDKIEHSLNLRTRIQLFGHKHIQSMSYIYYNNKNKTLKLIAGAIHPDFNKTDWKPRYNIISLEGKETPASLKIKLYPRLWNDDLMEFIQDPICGGDDFIEYPLHIEQKFDPTKNALKIFEEDLHGQHIKLETNSCLVTIGRSDDNDIVLPERTVSREHGMILFRNQGYIYRHLSRINRSRVEENDGKIWILQNVGTECAIENNSKILIGPRKLVVNVSIPGNFPSVEPMPPTENE